MNFKHCMPIALGILLAPGAVHAATGFLAGSIGFNANPDGTISTYVARGKNFSVPAQANIQYYNFCPVGTDVDVGYLWQVVVDIPVTFTCGCVSNPIVTVGLESDVILTQGSFVLNSVIPVVGNVTSNGFSFTAVLQFSVCAELNIPLDIDVIVELLNLLGPVAVNFNAACVK